MRILILGGTGAIGSELVRILSAEGNLVDVTTRSDKALKICNVRYLLGDAHDITFLRTILKSGYDTIVDFMAYTTAEFTKHYKLLLQSTEQYIFLSTARVFADQNENRIKEESNKLFDVCIDEEYLKTDEYALAKTRQEKLLKEYPRKNWTIVRPYITYNNERLQLGAFEKELWLYRALCGKTIVFSDDLAFKVTTLTHGVDVAFTISKMVGNYTTLGEDYNVIGNESITWRTILSAYIDIIESETGNRPNIIYEEKSTEQTKVIGNEYQIKYDRIYNRKFDNSKIFVLLGSDYLFQNIEYGVKDCLKNFINNNKNFKYINWKWEAYADRVSKEHTRLTSIPSHKSKCVYFLWRYFPILGKLKNTILGHLKAGELI